MLLGNAEVDRDSDVVTDAVKTWGSNVSTVKFVWLDIKDSRDKSVVELYAYCRVMLTNTDEVSTRERRRANELSMTIWQTCIEFLHTVWRMDSCKSGSELS